MARALRDASLTFALLLVAGCRGDQHSLDPAGHQADAIARHWWFFLIVSTVVYVLVAVALVWALFRRKRNADQREHDRHSMRVIGLSVGITVVVVFVFLVHAVWTNRTLGALPERDAIRIEVTGQQWWWHVLYKDASGSPYLTTANEIHIPVGVPVKIELLSRDVIHSFWVPNLHGKIDLIPGHRNALMLRADRAGVFRGQCAEFCGLQHALMGFLVVAQPRDEWERWLRAQQQPSAPPQTAEQARGRELFVSSQCAVCHTVRGTTAFGHTGPDLTHLASRRTIAAATLPNRRGHLGGWISDPQNIKAGTLMPPSDFGSEDFKALLSYLESLR